MDKGSVTFAEDHKGIHWPADVFFLLFCLIPSGLKKKILNSKNIYYIKLINRDEHGGRCLGGRWSHGRQANAMHNLDNFPESGIYVPRCLQTANQWNLINILTDLPTPDKGKYGDSQIKVCRF